MVVLDLVGGSVHPSSLPDTNAKRSRGILTYCRYAKLDHLLNILIGESWMPLEAAVVAAPILKLWVLYFVESMPICDRAACTAVAKCWRVRGQSSLNMNKGLAEVLRAHR